jgi:adenine-specific DNA-methyltransferase
MPPRKNRLPGAQPTADLLGVVPAEAAKSYTHPEAAQVSRPEIGSQDRFRDKKPPATYRYDSSLAPELRWDAGGARVRERAEELLRIIEAAAAVGAKAAEGDAEAAAAVEAAVAAKEAARELRSMQAPFLDWTGKAERGEFEVPTLPLFVHERLSTQAILESVRGWKRDQQVDLFGDPQRPIAEQLRAYEHRDRWVNRMILGDSLVVMNSLLQYEGMGGQVQMIYIDPPYGVKFGSNFQPFVRKRDVKHNDDVDLTREPEMVQAYRDTWELGLHSYLTYLRDRLMVARELLTDSGSVFVQISDENLHHVREVMDEVFGATNFCSAIAFRKTTGKSSALLDSTVDFLLWYARDRSKVKYRALYEPRTVADDDNLRFVELPNGSRRRMTPAEASGREEIPTGARAFRPNPLTSARPPGANDVRSFEFQDRAFTPGNRTFSTDLNGLRRLDAAARLMAIGNTLTFVRFLNDFPYRPMNDVWDDTRQSGFGESKLYVVQTSPRAIQRCVLMTTDPGDLVLDPTCGSGTTAYVAEQWGRRWITIDTSRVPLALARQRLLTATFPWHDLKDDARGPAGGFVYERKQNKRGEEVGGLVPHITLKSIANDEPPQMEVLVDRPEQDGGVTRVTGPFVVEATIPTPVDWEGDGISDSGIAAAEEHSAFADRMLEVLRRSPQVHLGGNKTAKFEQVRRPAKAMVLSAEGIVAGTEERVAFVFGPEHGAVSEQLVHQALKEADRRNYAHLYVVGFAVEPAARMLVESTRGAGGSDVEAWYVQATPDLIMGSLLKTTRASQLFSVCGLPDVEVQRAPNKKDESEKWSVHLRGVDTFDPSTMETRSVKGSDVPAWFLDTDYNGRVFRVCQAFFPRTQAWDALKRSLKAEFDESLFDHLAGDTSAPFEPGEHRTVAVKVIDERGNELMVVQPLR